ncbi:MAG: ABC transporter substrate-binding protein, partial [Acetatifactor sp.]|nr:ABC transporter substrate-binding protein [Acetatifactor sp.]
EKVETVQFQEPEEGFIEHSTRYKILGKKIYMIRAESTEGKNAFRLCVQIYDTESSQMQQLLFVPQVPEHEHSSILSADLTAGAELSLKMKDWETENAFFLVRMNLEGDILKVTDPFPEEDSYPWNREFWDNTSVFDLDDGRTILGHSNIEEGDTRLTWFREDTGSEEPLGTLSCTYIKGLIPDEEGIFYFLDGASLIRWDVEKNVLEVLFHLYENGIELGIEASGLIRNEKGEFRICSIQPGKATIYILTDKESSDKEKIQLCSLQGAAGISYFQRLAVTFTQNGGEIPINMEMESREEYQEDYRTRIMAEMVSGEGPDILYVSQEDMILMQEKGMLCDLSDMIAQETKAVMIPGVLELGTVNGDFVGLVPEVSFMTLGTSDKLWTEKGWNTEELAGVLKAAGSLECPVAQMGIKQSGANILFIFLQDINRSSFLDFEQGTAHFDCEEFIEILELCKQYGDERSYEEKMKQQLSVDERIQLLREGETAAEILYFYGGLDAFSLQAARYGDEGHIVGFPVESGSGNYVDSYSFGYLVVNAKTKYKEEISKFFAWLLDYDNQFKTNGGCVRMDVIRDSVYHSEWGEVMLRSSDLDNLSIQEIELKPDGTSYLEEYLAFVEGCEPRPYWPPQIRMIIIEEVAPFFEGRKSAAEVADTIQRRVQLYLDETG